MVIKLGWGMQALAFWMNPLGKEFLRGDTKVGPWLFRLCGEYRYHWLVCDSDFTSNCLCPLYHDGKSTCGDFCGWIYVVIVLKHVFNECQDDIRLWIVSEMYLKHVLNECQNDIRLWIVSELYLKHGISIRITSISGSYLNCFSMYENLE